VLCQRRTGSARRGIHVTAAIGPACVGCPSVHDRCLAVAAQIKRIFVSVEVQTLAKEASINFRSSLTFESTVGPDLSRQSYNHAICDASFPV
jgi:hypothetical protein